MISVSVNNEVKQCDDSRELSELLREWGFECEKIAVAINGDFVPRSQYSACQLKAGDQLDVLAPVQGG
ncbi:MAG: sulfur carrier protein ThiS [Spongiibacter sp.]|uniref:Sulfur carrier protein ThiS n=1 Tax=Spongiibacter thalassae TaxID=2721624 RepID=A0ABX1GHZ2_9GAMM|nr:sulfur carrier protein ThiS [Spongiibacter sp.]NKI18097.1 sulfur carrier protein ThiS [Spongiibacter thalassae]